MTIGDLLDILEEKLRTGEFNRMDTLFIGTEGSWYRVDDVIKGSSIDVVIVSDGLDEDLEMVVPI